MIKLKNIFFEQAVRYHIYCDMDGVLTDFDKLFQDISGGEFETGFEHEKKYGKGSHWKIIDAYGIKFWSHMPWMPEGKKLWKYIISIDPHAEILSAPSRSPTSFSRQGKPIWITRELGPNVKMNLVLAHDKYKFASPNHILIDDMEENIEKWNTAGGIGIVFKSTGQVIAELQALGI